MKLSTNLLGVLLAIAVWMAALPPSKWSHGPAVAHAAHLKAH